MVRDLFVVSAGESRRNAHAGLRQERVSARRTGSIRACYDRRVFTPVRLATIAMDPRDGTAVVVLEHGESGGVFPLWVSDDEARALVELSPSGSSTALRAPDLLHGVIHALGGTVTAARITGVVSLVVRAELVIGHGDEERVFPSRPADAIALALRSGAPVLVESTVLELVATRVREACELVSPTTMTGAEHLAQSTAERWNQLIAHLSSTRPARDASEM
jgi:bifunctional DNase/RNase